MNKSPKTGMKLTARAIALAVSAVTILAAVAGIASCALEYGKWFHEKPEPPKKPSISAYNPRVIKSTDAAAGVSVEIELIVGVNEADATNCKGEIILSGGPAARQIDNTSATVNGGPTEEKPLRLKTRGGEYRLTLTFLVPHAPYYDDTQFRLACDGQFTPLKPIRIAP